MVEIVCRFAYAGASLIFLGWLFVVLVARTRAGLIVGITVTTFALGALPFRLLPIKVSAQAVAIGAACLTALYFLLRPDSRRASRALANQYMFVLALIALALVAFLLVGHVTEYGRYKAIYFVSEVVLPVLAFAMLSPFRPADFRLVFRTLVGGAILMSLAVLGAGVLSRDPTSIQALGNPITLSRTIGLGVVVLFVSVVASPELRGQLVQRTLWLCVGLSLTVVIPILGNRGVLLAALAGVTSVFLIPAPQRPGQRRAAIAALALAGLAVFGLLTLPSDTARLGLTAAFSSKLNDTGHTADDVARLERLRVAASSLSSTNWIGLGTGGFAAEYASVSGTQTELAASNGRDYPHNIFFELAAELGVVGIILAVSWVLVCLKGLARVVRAGAPEAPLLLALWVFALVNACVSGDIVSNGAVMVFGALPWLATGSVSWRPNLSTVSAPASPPLSVGPL